MEPKNCPRCHQSFFAVIPKSNLTCPFCGYVFTEVDLTNQRTKPRITINRECVLSNGFGTIGSRTIDISISGLGLLIPKTVPFDKGSVLHARINDYKISEYGQVVWVKKIPGNLSKAGIKFYGSTEISVENLNLEKEPFKENF